MKPIIAQRASVEIFSDTDHSDLSYQINKWLECCVPNMEIVDVKYSFVETKDYAYYSALVLYSIEDCNHE